MCVCVCVCVCVCRCFVTVLPCACVYDHMHIDNCTSEQVSAILSLFSCCNFCTFCIGGRAEVWQNLSDECLLLIRTLTSTLQNSLLPKEERPAADTSTTNSSSAVPNAAVLSPNNPASGKACQILVGLEVSLSRSLALATFL